MIILWILIDLIRYWRQKRKERKTEQLINDELGYYIGIEGEIGAGKTTMSSGIISIKERYYQDLANDNIDRITTIFRKFSFVELNKELNNLLHNNDLAKPIDLYNSTYDLFKEYVENRSYNNGLKKVKYTDLMLDYIEAYSAIFRSNYVFANVKFRSVNTGKISYSIDANDFKLKERFLNHDFIWRRYAIYFFDDITEDSQKVNYNWQAFSNNDDGTLQSIRLIRQLLKETGCKIDNLQDWTRLIKAERELYTSIIHVNEKKDCQFFVSIKTILKIINWFNEKFRKIYRRITRRCRLHEDKKSLYRRIKYNIMHALDILDSKDFLKYKVIFYKNTKGESLFDGKKTSLIMSKKSCYAPTDTHYYSYLFDASLQTSKKDPVATTDFNSIDEKISLAKKHLKKLKRSRNDKKEKEVKL